MIYYAFDNTVNSSRYPYYSYMKASGPRWACTPESIAQSPSLT